MRITLGPRSPSVCDLRPPRPLSEWERDLFRALLDESFESRVADRQMLNAVVEAECVYHCPTIWVRVADGVPPLEDLTWGPTSGALPVMGVAEDADGTAINAIIQIADGFVREFDIHRVDGRPFQSAPAAAGFRRGPL